MNLYDTLTQKALNSIIYKMLNYISIVTTLNMFSNLVNDYCNLEFDFKGNDISGDEVIVTEDFLVTCTDREFTHLGYSLKLNYYYLPSDLDESHQGEVLKTVTIPLSEVDNVISFEEYPVYIQGDCELILENTGTVILPTPEVLIRLTADHHDIIYGNNVVLTATVSINGEPVSGGTVKFYDDNETLLASEVTDGTGKCSFTVEDIPLGEYWYHAVYTEYSSNNVKIVSRKKNPSLSITTSANSIYYSQSVEVTGNLKDEFGTALANKTVKLFENNTQVATATTNNNGDYSFNRQYTNVGSYNLKVKYDGDSDRNAVISNTKTLTVNKAPVSINIKNRGPYDRGDHIIIEVSSISSNFTPGIITVEFNGVTSTLRSSGRTFGYTFPGNMDNGELVFKVTYNGDSNYNSAVATSIITIVVISKLTLTQSGNNLIINCKNDGSDVTGFNVSMRLYLASSTYIDISSTTDSNGNITVQNIIQSGRSYYAVYRNITSNTLTT